MKILIEYESSWRNSFLDGDNNEALPKKGRKFIGSMTSLRQADNFIKREVTLDTVMGVLSRLIGDQRKLYQARSEQYGQYFFKDLEQQISFQDSAFETHEMTYIRNMTGSTDQNSFTGSIITNDVIFSSDYSAELWGVLALSFKELCLFIIQGNPDIETWEVNPLSICSRFEEIRKIKAVENEDVVAEVVQILDTHFPGTDYLNAKGLVVPGTVYCSSLYLQLQRLSSRFDISSALTKTGVISGISKRIFTKKDFMNRFTTGGKKKIWGNPYVRKERIKGEGEVVTLMTKANGQLEITIDLEKSKAQEIKKMIENAGVSSFYIGKKGLAYVSKIRL
jgi:hypothetical protein